MSGRTEPAPGPATRRTPGGRPEGRAADHDLPLKVATRRLLWRMGCSTRLDVRLRGDIPTGPRGASFEEFTDLDVLGIGFTPAGQLHTTFADCRSSQKAPWNACSGSAE